MPASLPPQKLRKHRPLKIPAYAGKLTDSDISDVVAYIKTLKK